MNEASKHQVKKQLKAASNAIDLIKISQRSQHTSIKEALRKMLRSISMLAEVGIEVNEDFMEKAREIRKNREEKEKEAKDDTNKTKS